MWNLQRIPNARIVRENHAAYASGSNSKLVKFIESIEMGFFSSGSNTPRNWQLQNPNRYATFQLKSASAYRRPCDINIFRALWKSFQTNESMMNLDFLNVSYKINRHQINLCVKIAYIELVYARKPIHLCAWRYIHACIRVLLVL